MTLDPTPAKPHRPEWQIALAIVAAIALVATIGVGIWWWTTQRTIAVDGDITVTSSRSTQSVGGACTTSGGFTDIAAGAQVVIKDGTGKVVATTTLGPGTGVGGACTFPFKVAVPQGSDFYGVELGRRGVVQYGADQLAAGVHLTLGG